METLTQETTYPKFFTVSDVQKMLGIGRNNAYKLVTQKDFPSIYVGNRIIVPTDLFHAWVDRNALNNDKHA